MARIPPTALLWGLFLRFLRSFHVFIQLRCPWHSGLIIGELVPIPMVRFECFLCSVLVVLFSCACTFVVGRWPPVSTVHMSGVSRA